MTGGFAAFPGSGDDYWCALKGWDKHRQRGVYQPFILIMQLVALAIFGLLARQSHIDRWDPAALAYAPAALLSTWSGLRFGIIGRDLNRVAHRERLARVRTPAELWQTP